MRARLPGIVLAVSLAIGCANGAYKVHPGAGGYVSGAATPLQTGISQAYDTLAAADAVIDQTRADFLANKFPASVMPKIHDTFNAVVLAYDTADNAWLALNQAASTGGTPSQDALNAALAGLNTALSGLAGAKVNQ